MDNGDVFSITNDMELIHSYKYLKNKYKIEYISSIIFAILTVLLFKEKIWLYPFSFILADFFIICLYKIMNCIFKHKYKMMNLQDKKEYLTTNLSCLRRDYDNYYYLLAKEASYQTEYNLEKIQDYIVEKQSKSENPEIQNYLDVFNSFKEKLKNINTKDDEDLYKNIINKLNNIIDVIKVTPQKTVFTNKIFNIYLPEIILLLNDTTNTDKIYDLLKDFYSLLKDVLKTIKDVDDKNTDITIELLKKEFKQNKEELRGDN